MYLLETEPCTRRRGDSVSGVKSTGRRVALSLSRQDGFSLIELVMTITIMTILTMGVIPLVKVSVRRQKEQRLREVLREMRTAIDDFHRDTVGMVCTGGIGTTLSGGAPPPPPGTVLIDPRSKVVVSDCTIFGVDNPDHYPPELQTLIEGVNVIPRANTSLGGKGLGTSDSRTTLDAQASTKKKVYLRELPVDPITGKAEWDFRSCYDASDSTSWGGENVFDVRSKAKDTALNGEKYSDW
jgi:general secretion pathway protein G